MNDARWIELAGASNVRDVGGLPTAGGGAVVAGRLVRSDSLQGLTPGDVRYLVDELDVRTVVDLRSGVEVRAEGPGPMTQEPSVTITNLSLFDEPGAADPDPDEPVADADAPVVLPWAGREADLTEEERRRGASAVYLRYLDDRPDSLLAALRAIAASDGATVVHCAAGKDRTGVVVAFALAEVGVTEDAIVADYARSAERIEAIMTRLAGSATYRSEVDVVDVAARHTSRPETMVNLLEDLRSRHGGAAAWLRSRGWTEHDAAALRRKLLDA